MTSPLFLDFEIEDYNLSTRKKQKSEIGNPAKVPETKFLSLGLSYGANKRFYDLRDEKTRKKIPEYLEDMGFAPDVVPVAVHNAPYDIPFLVKLGISPKRIIDTMSLAALYNSKELSYSLNDLGEKYLGMSKLEAPPFNADTDFEELKKYNMRDVLITRKLYEFYLANLEEEVVENVVELECDSTKIVCEMMEKGIRLDREHLTRYLEDSEEDWEKLLAKIRSFGVENPNSSKQGLEYLLKHGITPTEKTKIGNPSLGAESIERMLKETRLEETPKQFLELLLRYKKLNKRRDFAKGLIARSVKFASWFDKTNYDFLYPSYRALKGESFTSDSGIGGTGARFSSSSPNVQQFESGRKDPEQVLRKSILPLRPFETLYSLDYKAQEIRMFLHLVKMGEKHLYPAERRVLNDLIERYNRDDKFDFYEYLMEKGNPYLLRPRERYEWKQVTLAKMYGLSNAALAVKLEVPKPEVEKINLAFFQALNFYGTINRVWKGYFEKKGQIPTILKRRMYGDRSKAYRAVNYRVQGSSADQTKLAMVKCYKEHKILPYISLHDELVVSLPDDGSVEKVRKAMVEAIELCIPVVVEMKKGKNFGEMEEC